MATKVDILESDGIFTNSNFAVDFLIKKTDGSAQDITGWTFSWLVKRRKTDADASAVIAKTSAAGLSIIDAVAGHCQAVCVPVDTASLKGGVFIQELKRTNAGFFSVLIPGVSAPQSLFVLKDSLHNS